MSVNTAAEAAYIVADLLFIRALAGLSRHETATAGNYFGILGMAIALVIAGIRWPALDQLGLIAMWTVVIFALVSAADYFRKFWGSVDSHVKSRRRRELLARHNPARRFTGRAREAHGNLRPGVIRRITRQPDFHETAGLVVRLHAPM